MVNIRKAAEMALEALRNAEIVKMEQLEAMYALQEALAQPEQEPETVMAKYEFQTYAAYKDGGEMKIGVVPEHTAWVTAGEHTVPLKVSAPVDAVNMSQERVDETAKNRHEPVAWRNTETGEFCTGGFLRKDLTQWTPLYTAPPKREWVGLTRRELDIATLGLEDLGDCYKAIEAKLKEKNT